MPESARRSDGRAPRRGFPDGVRKVRAPQRRVAGNTRPPRGEDQCHSDDAGGGGSHGRSETRQTLPEARPSRRAQPGSPGERCAAQPSGRSHEPSGNRRPQMDDHRRALVRGRGTELGLQTASLTLDPRPGAQSRRCRLRALTRALESALAHVLDDALRLTRHAGAPTAHGSRLFNEVEQTRPLRTSRGLRAPHDEPRITRSTAISCPVHA
jgi:hypothetical protein